MTHLSDFSYLGRSTAFVYLGAYFIFSLWKNDKFESLRPSKIIQGELKSVLTIILAIMTCLQLSADITGTYIKYKEGFVQTPPALGGQIISKPYVYWSQEHRELSSHIDYVQCIAFSVETGLFFIVQCFWNYLSNNIAKKGFMSSFEFRFYIVWAISSMALFPFLQWYFRNDFLMREIAPQLAYSSEVLLSSFLGIRNNFRFKRLIRSVKNNNGSANVINKLNYFKDMNNMICIVLFLYGSSFFILCIDGLTTAQVIAHSKFASDVIISNANVCAIFYYILFISTFHPRRQFNTNYNSSMKESTQDLYKSSHGTGMGKDLEMNQRRFSQRVAHFVDLHQQQRQASLEQQQQQQHHEPLASKQFIKPMNAVSVNPQQPPHDPSLPTPTSTYVSHSNSFGKDISVRDPYSSQPVHFSVIEPQSPTITYDMNSSEIPLRTASPAYSHSNQHNHQQFHSDYSINHYVDDTYSR
ncbi:hypothetical protein BJ944DRAFT_262364 [Cunninghamella echinulata]|nr:hypothetical protein BJ944DRAFT_262364 [Cunninghamella echinulata]